jgi:DNA-binding NarL/FixJ family response regulator
MYSPIEIILADDHEIFRDGFRLMLKKYEEIKLVAEASDGKELVELARELKPDIIVTDIKMPVMDGIEATKLLVKELPFIGIVALSMYDEESQIVEILEAGAKGYLIKNAHKTEIVEAIKTVYKDQNYYCLQTTKTLAERIAGSTFKPSKPGDSPTFSEKDIDIIRLICEELSNKEIADRIGLSKRTVEWHRKEISEKLHTKNTAGIVVYAMRNKIYPISKANH